MVRMIAYVVEGMRILVEMDHSGDEAEWCDRKKRLEDNGCLKAGQGKRRLRSSRSIYLAMISVRW